MKPEVVLVALVISALAYAFQEEDADEIRRRQTIITNTACSCTTTPVITTTSGTIGHGNTVTLNGCCFGTKSTAAPLVFDNFEAGTLGGNIDDQTAVVGDWDSDGLPWDPIYDDTRAHTGDQSSLSEFRPGEYDVSLSKNLTFSRLYMDFWAYVDRIDNESRNFKIWRFYGGASDSLQLSQVFYCNAEALVVFDNPYEQNYWNGPHYTEATWQHYTLEYLESTPDVADGVARPRMDQSLFGVDTTSGNAFLSRKDSHSLTQIRIGNYWAGDALDPCVANSGMDMWTDDVYLDTVWNRVELCNASTYSSATHCEIQRPTAWSTTSVTVVMNTGSIGAGTRYLFAVDADGDKSIGKAVTIP